MPISFRTHGGDLSSIHERSRRNLALRCLVQLQAAVPWAILSLGRVVEEHDTVLALYDRGHEAGIERAARLFAACDAGSRDGKLVGDELLAAMDRVREDVMAAEASLPAEVSLSLEDPSTAREWAKFQALCDERLHEISLLRLFVPLPAFGQCAPTVAGLAAAAASRARGGEAAQAAAAAAAIEDAIVEERVRAQAMAARMDGVTVLPFVRLFFDLIAPLAKGQARSRRAALRVPQHNPWSDDGRRASLLIRT